MKFKLYDIFPHSISNRLIKKIHFPRNDIPLVFSDVPHLRSWNLHIFYVSAAHILFFFVIKGWLYK